MGAIELPEDGSGDYEEAESSGNSTLGFAGEQAAEDQTETTFLHHVPPKHLAVSAYAGGVLTTVLAAITISLLF